MPLSEVALNNRGRHGEDGHHSKKIIPPPERPPYLQRLLGAGGARWSQSKTRGDSQGPTGCQ